ncbi:MAG: PadR family transcriptional regulator [Aggregatilineales bacterium]
MVDRRVEVTERDLTSLEYVILGFLALKPQSGYTILNNLEIGVYRASASTGSVYPVLKRLEKAGLIASAIEAVYETRLRKVYTLLPAGEQLLDAWLRQPPTMAEVIEEYDIALHKFLIAEYRLSRAEVLTWLDHYEAVTNAALAIRTAIAAIADPDAAISPHAELINHSLKLETETRLSWIHVAQAHLQALSDPTTPTKQGA